MCKSWRAFIIAVPALTILAFPNASSAQVKVIRHDLTTKLFPQLGIAEEMTKKTKTSAARSVAAGDALVSGSNQRDAAMRLIAFLTSDRAADAIRRSGMEPSVRR
jgi:hypothetical protein